MVGCGKGTSALDLPGQMILWKGFSIEDLAMFPSFGFFGSGKRRKLDSGCFLRETFSTLCIPCLHDLQFCSLVSGKKKKSILLAAGKGHLEVDSVVTYIFIT